MSLNFAPSIILPWEDATLPPGTLIPGIVAPRHLRNITLVATLATLLVFMPYMGLWAVIPAFAFGRLLAFDLTTYTLPNIYTYPLIAAGLAHTVWMVEPERLIPAAVIYGIYRATQLRPLPIGMGGGDYKLLTALFLWMDPVMACFTLAAGCFAWLPFTLKNPDNPIPFGVPLLVGWVAMLAAFHIWG